MNHVVDSNIADAQVGASKERIISSMLMQYQIQIQEEINVHVKYEYDIPETAMIPKAQGCITWTHKKRINKKFIYACFFGSL